MADTLSIEAKTKLAEALSQLNALAASLGLLGKQGTTAAGGLNQAGNAAGTMATKGQQAAQSTSQLSSAIGTLQGALAAVGIGQFVKDSTDLFVQQEQAINILAGATGDIGTAREEFERWRHVTETLGLEFNKSSILYARLLVTAEQAGIPIENARAAADGLAIAQRAMNLSSYDAELAFRALGQIANKTVVNMEELRQQLGERVAGVMLALSQRMGITTRELFSLAETGELTADVFFQKFGPAMAEAFKDQAIQNADSLAANLERIGNAGRRIQVEFATGFADELNRAIGESAVATESAESGFRDLGEVVGFAAGVIGAILSKWHAIRSFFADVTGGLLGLTGSVLKSTQGLVGAYGFAESAVWRLAAALARLSKDKEAEAAFRKMAENAKNYGVEINKYGDALIETGFAMLEVAKDQRKFQESTDNAAKATDHAKDEINALAEGANTVGGEFNKLDPEVAKFIDRMNDLGEKSNIAVLAIKKLMDQQGGALNPSQLAAARNEVEKLVRAYDFKDIPPELMEVAKALGVSTTETKKNTEATKQASAAQRELLQEINRVTDALQRQAESSKEAAKENKEEIAELEKKFLTGLDPEELNRLNDLKDNQANLDRQAAKDAEAAADAQQLLVDASLAAGQTAEAASVQYDKAATSLLGVEQASLNARDRLLELQAAFAASGGAAGQFAVPGGSPSVPGAPQGPQGPIPPGAAPLNQGFGPNANEFQFTGLSAQGPGWGTPGVDFSNQPIDLFRALDAGVEGTDPNVIAQMLVEQWTSAADKALLEAVKETPSAAPVRIESVKQGAIGTIPNAFGVEPGPGGNAEQVIQKITNVQEAADQAGDVLVDAFESGGASMFNLGIASKDAAKEIKGVGDAVNKDFVGPIQQATTAAEGLPDGIIAAGQALEGASASGVDYTQAIKRAEGATGDLGFTAESAAGSIASAAGAAATMAEQAADLSDRAADGQREVANLSKERVKLLEREVILLEKINKLYGGEAVDISDIPPLS